MKLDEVPMYGMSWTVCHNTTYVRNIKKYLLAAPV